MPNPRDIADALARVLIDSPDIDCPVYVGNPGEPHLRPVTEDDDSD